jgi:electron transport complex protein RnfA
VSNRLKSAFGMGCAVTFVMTLTALVTWLIDHCILQYFGVQDFLKYVAFILVIASLVQFVEMFLRKVIPDLYRALGIFLPLITTNCAILGLALFASMWEFDLMRSVVFGLGAGIGFTVALVIMAGIREHLEFADMPEAVRGIAITLVTAGLLSLAFMGFSGML